jgi:hypothetical protein
MKRRSQLLDAFITTTAHVLRAEIYLNGNENRELAATGSATTATI